MEQEGPRVVTPQYIFSVDRASDIDRAFQPSIYLCNYLLDP
jgi:hypothetical protein